MISPKPPKRLQPEIVAGGRQKHFALFKFRVVDGLKRFASLYRLWWSNSSVPKDLIFSKIRKSQKCGILRAFTIGNPIVIWSRFRIIGKCHCTQGRKMLRITSKKIFLIKKYFFMTNLKMFQQCDSSVYMGFGDARNHPESSKTRISDLT